MAEVTRPRHLVLFIVGTIAVFVYICSAIPQIKSQPMVTEVAIGHSPEDLVVSGRAIFESDRAQCLTCHSLGEDPKARCPNQEGVGASAGERKPGHSAAEYLIESLYNPNAFVVAGYPKNQMTPVNKPPITLSHDEILAVVAFLNSLGGRTDSDFIERARSAQEPWRKGLLQAEEAAERARLPIFPGDAVQGRDVFRIQGCDKCHPVESESGNIAPDLKTIGAAQSPEYLLESILQPSQVIVKGYSNTIVFWKDERRFDIRGTPVAWLPNEDRPRVLRLSVLEGNEPQEIEVDLSLVAQVGDTRLGVKNESGTRLYCGYLVEGDEESGVLLKLMAEGGWGEQRFPPEVIDFLHLPLSPMPSNYADLMTPGEVFNLLAYLMGLKGV